MARPSHPPRLDYSNYPHCDTSELNVDKTHALTTKLNLILGCHICTSLSATRSVFIEEQKCVRIGTRCSRKSHLCFFYSLLGFYRSAVFQPNQGQHFLNCFMTHWNTLPNFQWVPYCCFFGWYGTFNLIKATFLQILTYSPLILPYHSLLYSLCSWNNVVK
jgi:hypothetical protein